MNFSTKMVLLKFLLLFMLTHLTTALNTNYPDVNKYPVNITNEGDEQTESFSKLETFEVDVFSASNVKTYFFSDFTANNSAKIIYTLPIGVRNKTFVTLKYGTDGHNVTVEFKSNITNDVPNPRDLEGLYIVYLIDQSSYQQLARAIRFRVVLKDNLKANEEGCSLNSECQSNHCVEDDKKVKKCKCNFGQFYKKENTTEKCIDYVKIEGVCVEDGVCAGGASCVSKDNQTKVCRCSSGHSVETPLRENVFKSECVPEVKDDKFDKDCITTEQCESKANLVCYPGIFKCNCAVKDAKGGDVWYSKGKTCESIRFGCKENKQCTDKFDHTICENEICKCSSGNYNLTKFCSHSSITTSNIILLIVAAAFTFKLNYN